MASQDAGGKPVDTQDRTKEPDENYKGDKDTNAVECKCSCEKVDDIDNRTKKRGRRTRRNT